MYNIDLFTYGWALLVLGCNLFVYFSRVWSMYDLWLKPIAGFCHMEGGAYRIVRYTYIDHRVTEIIIGCKLTLTFNGQSIVIMFW